MRTTYIVLATILFVFLCVDTVSAVKLRRARKTSKGGLGELKLRERLRQLASKGEGKLCPGGEMCPFDEGVCCHGGKFCCPKNFICMVEAGSPENDPHCIENIESIADDAFDDGSEEEEEGE